MVHFKPDEYHPEEVQVIQADMECAGIEIS